MPWVCSGMDNRLLELKLQLTSQEEHRPSPWKSKTAFAGTTVTISVVAARAAGARWRSTFRNITRDRAWIALNEGIPKSVA